MEGVFKMGDWREVEKIIEGVRTENRRAGLRCFDNEGNNRVEEWISDLVRYDYASYEYEKNRLMGFLNKTTNPQTSNLPDKPNWWQPQTLLSAGVIPKISESIKNKTFPLRWTTRIVRMQLPDKSEFLKSEQMMRGLQRNGTTVDLTLSHVGTFENPEIVYDYVKSDCNDNNSKLVLVGKTNGRSSTSYRTQFTRENFNSLYEMKRNWSAESEDCGLSIYRPNSSGVSYEIKDVQRFVEESFDSLYDWASATKFNLDNSIKDTLNQHFKMNTGKPYT